MIVGWLLYGQKRNWGGNKFPDRKVLWIESTDKNSISIPPTSFTVELQNEYLPWLKKILRIRFITKNKQGIDIWNGGSIYQPKTLKSTGVAKKIEFIVDSLITTLDD